jgi:hypothetical protein
MLSVKFHEDETAVSFCSRLAAANEISLAANFTSYFGVSFTGVAMGRSEDVRALCRSFGLPMKAVSRSVVCFDNKNALLRGQWYFPQNIVQGQFRFCSHCLQEDMDRSFSSTHHCYSRMHWMVRFNRSCPKHEVCLVTLATDHRLQWDFSAQLRSHLGSSNFRKAVGTPAVPGAQEHYLLMRMEGKPTSFPWLDRIPLQAVLHFSELLGNALTNGISRDFRQLAESELATCAAAGFAVLSQGDEAIRDCLRSLARANWLDGLAKPESSFGTMIDELWALAGSPGYLSFLGLLQDVAWDERGTRIQKRIRKKQS